MNLKEFVKNVLVDIDGAVSEARQETQRNISFSNTSEQRTVEFDVAVSVEETGSKSGKAGVRVLEFVEGGADITKESKNSTVSRVKFGVQISPLTKNEQALEEKQWMEQSNPI